MKLMVSKIKRKNLYLASPRGFCAGVERAIKIVERALEKYGNPIYVRHEIVHNKHVVNRLARLGAIFVEDLTQVPDGSHIVFSAHGVAQKISKNALVKELNIFDATCPLVTKVHLEAQKLYKSGYHILLIGHEGHPEIEGTKGQVPEHCISLIQTIEEANKILIPNQPIAWLSQTTLSVDDTAEIVSVLKSRFPKILGPRRGDICYATSNRQYAVKEIASLVDVMIIVGSQNSSNSKRLVEVAERAGCNDAILVSDVSLIDWRKIDQYKNIGLSSGASAPETLIDEIRTEFSRKYETKEIQNSTNKENVYFKLPKSLD